MYMLPLVSGIPCRDKWAFFLVWQPTATPLSMCRHTASLTISGIEPPPRYAPTVHMNASSHHLLAVLPFLSGQGFEPCNLPVFGSMVKMTDPAFTHFATGQHHRRKRKTLAPEVWAMPRSGFEPLHAICRSPKHRYEGVKNGTYLCVAPST